MREYHYHSRGDLRPGNRTSAGREFSGEQYTTGRVAITLATPPSAAPANRVEPRGAAGLDRRESSLGKRGRSHDHPPTASASAFRHPPVDYLGEDEEASDEIVTEFRSSSNGEEEEEEEGVEWCTASLGYRPRQQQQQHQQQQQQQQLQKQQQKQQVLSRLGGGPDNNASEIQAGHAAAILAQFSTLLILI